MAVYTSPATWNPGEIPAASKLNTHIRDNLLCLQPAYSYGMKSVTTNQSFTGNPWEPVICDVAPVATLGITVTRTISLTRFLPTVKGIYTLGFSLYVTATDSTPMRILINGAVELATSTTNYNGGSYTNAGQVVGVYEFNGTTDYWDPQYQHMPDGQMGVRSHGVWMARLPSASV